jgi:hypothetical protein
MEQKGNKEQMAVDWLLNHIWSTDWVNYTREEKLEVINQAREMGRKQIIMAHDDQYNYDMWPSSIPTLGQQYYNENYG